MGGTINKLLKEGHRVTSYATQAASRVFQTRRVINPPKFPLYMESIGATEWSMDTSVRRFLSNYYVEIEFRKN